ncbi:Outer membrane scaffolding protein for murein synthesis, MipA/OmpV family [Rhizobium sp. RU35A]|uniref:MipA/OmpV family protein n=1 Tax=Rhizobium sp. RU35A TaxID=1907414 RepID=UPI00095503A0|nr:MipA/OmpV family protein [Rhizobium sp. RU35A]SIP98483.1 Outer membrane scaffolding protein for murein synthesis, MipA/OmpV family [Rhizobium sp. RU35A]
MFFSRAAFVAVFASVSMAVPARAQEGHWWKDWYLTLGGMGFQAPKYQGDDRRGLSFSPVVALGRGERPAFVSRNDSPSMMLLGAGGFHAGVVGRFVPSRRESRSEDLQGLGSVKWGLEAGGFAELYPVEGIRVRGEVRQGIRAHDGVVADLALDGYSDLVPGLQVSGGPRITLASKGYQKTYFGVSDAQSLASGLAPDDPQGGLHAMGVGAAISWKSTDRLTIGSFAEYRRLMGDAADSSLVQERGSRNQIMVGVSATYTFGYVPGAAP